MITTMFFPVNDATSELIGKPFMVDYDWYIILSVRRQVDSTYAEFNVQPLYDFIAQSCSVESIEEYNKNGLVNADSQTSLHDTIIYKMAGFLRERGIQP